MFPTLDSATNPQFEGIRLMDVAERVASDDLGQNLRASGFHVDEDNRVAHLWAQKTSICIHIPQLAHTPQTPEPDKSISPIETPTGSCTSDDPREDRKMLREHISNALKREIKQLVVDLFPRDSDGVILSESSDIPSLRRPSWVLDELHRSLNINWSREDAAKGLKFAARYVKRERRRQKRVISDNSDANALDREELRSEMLAWKEGPYGKAWAANLRERPRPQQLLAASSVLPIDNDVVFKRYAIFHLIKLKSLHELN